MSSAGKCSSPRKRERKVSRKFPGRKSLATERKGVVAHRTSHGKISGE
jgi:hypothetical protein